MASGKLGEETDEEGRLPVRVRGTAPSRDIRLLAAKQAGEGEEQGRAGSILESSRPALPGEWVLGLHR